MYKTIKEVEDAVGRKAADVIVRAREIVVVFSGKPLGNGSLGAPLYWHISTK